MGKIRLSYESERGCGYRKAGGLYLVCDGAGSPCGRLPLPLDVCRACGGGIKPTRGVTNIAPRELFGEPEFCTPGLPGNPIENDLNCAACPAGGGKPEHALLIWVGGKFYPTPADFVREANTMGISRRITAIPKNLELGVTWVFLAHREAITIEPATEERHAVMGPGVFYAFRPERVEKVVDPDNLPDDDELEALEKRGIEPVVVRKKQTEMEVI